MRSDAAGSHSVATILLVLITILLAALVLLLFQLPPLNFEIVMIPSIFMITNVIHTDDVTGNLNYDSRLVLLHTGILPYNNADLKASILKNGQPVNCVIETLNGNDFISTAHFGVQWIGGAGCSGATWEPGEMTAIDLTDGTFHPGDTAQIDIIDNSTHKIISRHAYRV